MAKFTATISTNLENIPSNVDTTCQVRVRIPSIHGVPDDRYYIPDNQLPFAFVSKPVGFSGVLNASEYFNDGDAVFVEMLNNDINNLLIEGVTCPTETDSGFGGGMGSYTFTGANSLVQTALSQVKNPPINDGGIHKTIYGDEYQTGFRGPWCSVFVWWCFKHSGNQQYYNGGKPNGAASCPAVYKYHKNKGEIITEDYKAGDVIFFNWSGGNNPQHVGIAVEDYNPITKKLITVEGNTSSKNQSNGGCVMRKERSLDNIVCGMRPGLDTIGEQDIFKWFKSNVPELNTAAICGILANMFFESGYKPTKQYMEKDGYDSYGLCQWHKGRYDKLQTFCSSNNMDYRTAEGQLNYLMEELNTSYKTSVYDPIKQVSNTSNGAYNAAEIWCKKFEKPQNADSAVKDKRGPMARELFDKYKNSNF